MADSDPISESTPSKRRKLNDPSSKAWDSQDDSGEEFTVEDFNTVATVPVPNRTLTYTKEQFHSDLRTNDNDTANTHPSSPPRTFITQPTQTLRLEDTTPPPPSKVLVTRSSPPAASSSPKPPPQPIRRPFSKPAGFLARTIAPPGTAFRAPLGIPQNKPEPIAIDDDSDEDPPVHHSSDEEGQTQGFRSNLKPTNFQKGGRGLNSTPNRVAESPRAPAADTFKSLLSEFNYSSPSRPVDDMVSAYGNSRRPQHQHRQVIPPKASNAVMYHSVDDIDDYLLRKKVIELQQTFQNESVQRCMDALKRRHGNIGDAMEWLSADQDALAEDEELPISRRGVAVSKETTARPPQPVKIAAKQEVKAPTRTIAEKYRSTQAARRPSQPESPEEKLVAPRRRLQQGRKSARTSPSPRSSPPPAELPHQQTQRQPIVIDDDDESEGDAGEAVQEVESTHDRRVLDFFNKCSVEDLADLSGQAEEIAKSVLQDRPFTSLGAIRNFADITKPGKRARLVGDKIVETCSEMLAGYDAVDELVEKCKELAQPIQAALKAWGVGATEIGELDLTHVDQDSGIGTPTSSDDNVDARTKGGLLRQPKSMSSEQTLKDYQLVGLNWLSLLWSKKLSCILADDMGLGKTCQVIAFLAHLQEQAVDGVHLIIVPGSTLENWIREFHRFGPSLNVVPYYGSQKERIELQDRIESEFDSIDVVITTYDMAAKDDDNRFLRKHVDPLVCVFDEGHALRNPNSARYQQLTRIPASFRVLLTGTPLQNNLRELVAILAFVMPEVFKEKEDELQSIFHHTASTKEAHNPALLSAQRISRARSMITPFILRRKKEQVLELPTKRNKVEYCTMSRSQAAYYKSLVEEYVSGTATTKKAISNTLTMLRKAAIHPLLARRLYDDKKIDKIVTELLKNPEFAENEYQKVKDYLTGAHHQSFGGGDFGLHKFCHERPYLRKFELKKTQWMDSGKVTKFKELIQAYAANGDRVLVFCQWTTVMDILEAVLETLNIKFMRLDGSTNMQIRQDMIDKFTDDTSITVFMLSTKAGGAGINLASANKVIIFHSGFNPQDDIQAENRAHRVGQTSEVEVVRLVSKDTIEEAIHALGESKLELGERVAEGASAAEERQAERAGEDAVAKMFMDGLSGGQREEVLEGNGEANEEDTIGVDLKDAFKCGLENAGVRVSSKQAMY